MTGISYHAGKQAFRCSSQSTEQYDPIYRRMRREPQKILFISVEVLIENFLRLEIRIS